VTDRAGHVLASTDEELLDTLHPLAKRAIISEATVEGEDSHDTGLGLSLVYADASSAPWYSTMPRAKEGNWHVWQRPWPS
jgi:hypothetical protein